MWRRNYFLVSLHLLSSTTLFFLVYFLLVVLLLLLLLLYQLQAEEPFLRLSCSTGLER